MTIDATVIPLELRERPQWLIWKFEQNRKFPDKKPLKVPYYTNGKRRTGVQGDAADRANLCKCEDALIAAVVGNYSGIGFAFLPDDGLIGIDIDKCIDDDGVVSDVASTIITNCSSYTEYSPSRHGVHIIVKGHIPQSFKDNKIGVEVFCSSQYFTFTSNAYAGTPSAVNPISAAELERLRVLVKGDRTQGREASAYPALSASDERSRLESALACISPDCDYAQWYKIGMAIHSVLGDAGFAVWDYWSSRGEKYQGSDDLRMHWRSFGTRALKPNAGTLYHYAQAAGWRPPRQVRPPGVTPIKARPQNLPSPSGELNEPGVPPGDQNQGEEHDAPPIPPEIEADETRRRPSAEEMYNAQNPPEADAALEGGGGAPPAKKKKKTVVRSQSFWDAIDHLIDNFVLLYGTDTVWDGINRLQVKINAVRLAYGSDAVKFWLGNSARRMINFDCLVFDPTNTVDLETHINLYSGMHVAPKKGACDKIIDLLLHLCDGNTELASWIMRWIAFQLQNPGAKMTTSIIMHGDEGSGKNLFWEQVVRRLFGKYGGVITNAQIEAQFNEWASMKMFMVADEVVTRNELRQLKGKLKGMISGEVIRINPKNLPEREEENFVNFVFLSNELQPLALDKTDRRYLVVWTPPKRDLAYYKDVGNQIENGGLEAFYHYLLHDVDCGDMNEHTKPLETLAKHKLISLGLSAPERFYREWAAGALPLPVVCCSAQQLYQAFLRWSHLNGERYPPSQTEFGGKVERMAAGEVTRKVIKYDLTEVVKQRTVYVVGVKPDDKDLKDWVADASSLFESYLKKYRHVYDQSEEG